MIWQKGGESSKSEIRFKQVYLVDKAYRCIWPSDAVAAGFSLVIGGVRVHVKSEHCLSNTEFSLATNSCTRTRHRLGLKVWKITSKFRLAFNQILLFEPDFGFAILDFGLGRSLMQNRLRHKALADPPLAEI